jgi:hypothetical protein
LAWIALESALGVNKRVVDNFIRFLECIFACLLDLYNSSYDLNMQLLFAVQKWTYASCGCLPPVLLNVAYALDDGQVKILVILLNLCYFLMCLPFIIGCVMLVK